MPTAFSRSVRVFIDQNLSPKAQSAVLAGAARSGVSELVSSGQASPQYDTYVDGRKGASEDTVKPDGMISYVFENLGEVVQFAIKFLQDKSPNTTGRKTTQPGYRSIRYKDAWIISVDGRPIAASAFSPESLPVGAEILLFNAQPYARKIDVQRIGNKTISFTGVEPNMIAECAKAINARYGNVVEARRLYTVRFPGQYRLQQRQMRSERPHLVKRDKGEPVETPAVAIRLRGS